MGKTKTKQIKNVEGGKKKKTPPPPPPPAESSSEEESSEEEIVAKPVTVQNGKKAPNGVAKPAKFEEASSEEDDSSEEESDAEPPKKAPVKKTPAKKEESSSEEEDDSSEESEDEQPPAKKSAAPKAKIVKAKASAKIVKADSSSEEEESSEEESSEEEEEEKPAPKKAKKTAKKESSEEESSDEEEESDDEEEEEMEVEKSASKKRKGEDKTETPAKKAKVEEAEEPISLMIRNVDPEVEDKKIIKFFKKKGVAVGEVRRTGKPFAFVQLEDAADLDKALALSGEELQGQALSIEKARSKNKPQEYGGAQAGTPRGGGGGDDKDSRVLFVKNLPYEATEDMVREHFPGVQQVRMPLRDDGLIKGFGFLEFSNETEVDNAVKTLQGSELGGMSLLLDYSGAKSSKPKNDRSFGGDKSFGDRQKSSAEPGKTKVLFVKNLSWNLTTDTLREAFDGAHEARIAMCPDTGNSRGFGFVEFPSGEAAQSAHDAMQGQEVDGRAITVDYAAEKTGGGGGRGGGRGRGGFGGGRGGGGRGGRGGFGGGRGGGDRGRGGRGGRGGSRGGFVKRDGIKDFQGTKKTFD